MPNLQDLLIILGSQKLSAGYLTPVGTAPNAPNAHDTLRALKQQFDPYTLLQNPLPPMGNRVGAPNILFSPAWISSLAAGQDAIYLDGVDGNLDQSHTPKPAYIFSS